MATVVVIARVVLAVVFVTAGVGKLMDLAGSRQAMRDFGVPTGLADAFGLLLPVAEIVVAAGLIVRPTAQIAAVAAALLLAAFIAGIANALRHGVAPDCHCFGQIHSAPAGRSTLYRNGTLAVIAVVVAVYGTGPALNSWVDARSAAELVAIVLGLVAAGFAFQWFELHEEVVQLRTDIESARKTAAAVPPGPPVGTIAPPFELETLAGGRMALSQLHAETPALLVFASPWCGSCSEVFPSIRRWQQTLQEKLQIAVITAGTAKDNKELEERYGLRNVLIPEGREMIDDYRIRATPTALLVGQDGRVISKAAESVFAIEPLVRHVLRNGVEADQASLATPVGVAS
jgi:uncharacterized membrane protein YphA (DoxX/SURF4 family)/thiol-disulfide isomerase/thioredoxin